MKKQTVFVVGAGGMVGATVAQALAIKEVVSEIALIDVAEALVSGQAMDINHATAFTRDVRVRVGDYSEIKDDDIVILTCGLAQKPGQTRLELLDANSKIIRNVVSKVTESSKSPYIVVVANPVDILTKVALEVSGLPKERVFGTGTTLDTARFRVMIANTLGVSQQEVVGYILGEHGDSSFAALSGTTIGGVPLAKLPAFTKDMANTIDQDIRKAAYQIIEAKGSTYYGIGSVVVKIVEALLSDTASILSVCSLAEGEYGLKGVVIGLPSLVNNKGVKIFKGYPLSKVEVDNLHKSAATLSKASLSLQPVM